MAYKVECIGGRRDGDQYEFSVLPKHIKVESTTGEATVYYRKFKKVSDHLYQYKWITKKDYLKETKGKKRG